MYSCGSRTGGAGISYRGNLISQKYKAVRYFADDRFGDGGIFGLIHNYQWGFAGNRTGKTAPSEFGDFSGAECDHCSRLFVSVPADRSVFFVLLASLVFAVCMCVLNALSLRKYLGHKNDFVNGYGKPFLAAAGMGVTAWVVYYGLHLVLPVRILCLGVAMVSL